MLKKTSILAILLVILMPWADASTEMPKGKTLTGTITDIKDGVSLPGVTIYIPELKIGAITDINGIYTINNLPSKKVMVQVSFVGYKSIIQTLDLSKTSHLDFQMEYQATELNELVVTGLSRATERKRTSSPITIVPKTVLLENSSTNIINALSTQPGISEITTGPGISKPVIRGLGYTRVVVVNDGIRQEGQQWGDEHGIEIDASEVNRVEILKGPASLAYGSDAMAGVINMLTAPPVPEGSIKGNVMANYQTNNGLLGYSLNLAGNQSGLIWDLRYSNEIAHAYHNRYDGYVFNSGFREESLKGIIGLNKSWGYSHLTLSYYYFQPGIVEGDRDSITGNFIKEIILPDGTAGTTIASDTDYKSYVPEVPFQNVRHYKAVLDNNIMIGQGSLKFTLGYQQNNRQEYADILNQDAYGLYFKMNTLTYKLIYNLPQLNSYKLSFGVNGMAQNSNNLGSEFLIPAYNLFDFGAFAIAHKSLGKFDLSAGIRYDHRSEHGQDLYLNGDDVPVSATEPGSTHRFKAFDSQFSGVSGSVGATYQISEDIYTKLNLSRGYRAPNIAELGANGVHEGTFRFETGDPNLKPENSWELDYALGINTSNVSCELNLFYNNIDNFIFLRKLNSIDGGDSITDGVTTFKYVSGHANIYGGEASIDIHPRSLDWIHFENTFSYVVSEQRNQPDSMRYLPMNPPARFQSTLKFQKRSWGKVLENSYIKINFQLLFAQNKVYSAFGTETPTPGYNLINIGLGTDIMLKDKRLCSLYVSVNNLLDVAYQNHLSRLKYADVNHVTGRTGVYNMGRNISFKLVFPIGIKSPAK